MAERSVGVVATGADARGVVENIQDLESRGIPAAWLTTGGAGLDGLTLLSAAAVCTDHILLGTCITPTWPRHPIAAVQQVQVIANLARGRFRFGVGPSSGEGIKAVFGLDYRAPLTNLREYVHIVKTLLNTGSVDFDGKQYQAHGRIAEPMNDVPVMASALRAGHPFEFCGSEADGAISWVCPGPYLRDVAVPSMKAGAAQTGRPVPPLIAHATVCVHDEPEEASEAFRQQMRFYPTRPSYKGMFVDAGFPEANESDEWSEGMKDAVLLTGGEETVALRLRELFDWGAGELLVTVVTAGPDAAASWDRTVRLLAQVDQTL